MAQTEYILAIDQGTQSVRVGLFDMYGNRAAFIKESIEPYFSLKPGWAEQQPEYFWEKICQVCQRLWQEPGVDKSAVKGVALTTQRGTVTFVDRDGKSLRPAISWLDQRMVDDIPPLGGVWGNLFKVMGLSRDIRRVQCEAEVNWVRHNQPDIWKKTSKVLLLSGYLTHRLTGEYRDSSACIVGWLPFNYRTHKWEGAASWKWKTMLVERQMLPELVSPGEVLGHITRQVEKETGIPAGIPLIAAAADKACEVLGSGCLTSDMGCLSYGTTATLNVTYYKYLEAIPLLPPYPGPLPGTYNPEMDVKRGFWLVSWFKNEFGLREMQIAQERGIEAEELFDELVNAVPPGSLGLTLQPYWMPGFRTLDQSAKGAIIGFGEVHTRAHIYRAILEGLVYALREGKERVEQRGKVQIKELSACGGGARSRAALQITADIFGLPVSRPQTVETASLGAAIEGAVGLKMYPEFMTAVKGMVRKELTLMPDPEAQKLYEQLYSRVYKKMYERLKPLYEEIQKITGYPDPLDY